MPGLVDTDLLVFVHLNNPRVLHYKGYGAKADRLQGSAHQMLQLLVPNIRCVCTHSQIPSKRAVDR